MVVWLTPSPSSTGAMWTTISSGSGGWTGGSCVSTSTGPDVVRVAAGMAGRVRPNGDAPGIGDALHPVPPAAGPIRVRCGRDQASRTDVARRRVGPARDRSEEHTSELQSQSNLV